MHYVVLGAGPAGLTAAETLRDLSPHSEITVVSKENEIGYSRCLLTYLLTGQIGEKQVYIKEKNEVARKNIRFVNPAEPVKLNCLSNALTLSDGTLLTYDKLLVATGASPVIPDIPGIKGKGIHCLRTMEDARKLLRELPNLDSVILLGDGLVSVLTSIALNSRGLKTTVVGIATHILNTILDSTAAEILENKISSLGIELVMNQSFKEIHRDSGGNFEGVTLTNGVHINASTALIAAGVAPQFDFLSNTGIKFNKGLLVNDCLETSIPSVYAAGDVAEAFDYVRNHSAWNPLWPNAVEQGKCAAYNMAGKYSSYSGATNMNSVNIGNVSVISVGITNSSDSSSEVYVVKKNDHVYQKLVFQGSRLIGFILLGKTEKAGVLTALLSKKELSPIQKARLLKGDFDYSAISGL